MSSPIVGRQETSTITPGQKFEGSRDGQRVVSGSNDGTVREWDVENGETILGPIKTGHEKVWAVVYSPDMTIFATAGYDGPYNDPVKIWDAKTGKLATTLKGHRGWDRSIRTWNTTNWKQIAALDEHTSYVHSIAISPNGCILASASWDDTARLWNLNNNQPISSPLHHASAVNSVSFSSDGKLLVTGCWDKNAYTWDISAIVKEAGLSYLLSDQRDKSLLAADATRRPVRQPIKVLNRLPRGFF